jgi:hypothetical protein
MSEVGRQSWKGAIEVASFYLYRIKNVCKLLPINQNNANIPSIYSHLTADPNYLPFALSSIRQCRVDGLTKVGKIRGPIRIGIDKPALTHSNFWYSPSVIVALGVHAANAFVVGRLYTTLVLVRGGVAEFL